MKPAPIKSSSLSRSLLLIMVAALAVLVFNPAAMGAVDAAGTAGVPGTASDKPGLVPGEILKPEITVRDEVVRLGDVLDIFEEGVGDFAHIILTLAPAPGEKDQILFSSIKSVALRAGLEIENPTNLSRIFVTREGEPLMEEDLNLILVAAFQERALLSGDFTLTLHGRYNNINLPVGVDSERVRVASLTLDARTNRFRATLMVPVGPESDRRVDISGLVTEMQDIPVLARAVVKGEILTINDISWLSLPVKRITLTTAKSAEALIGMAARRTLKSGTPIRLSDIERPLVIKKGALVAMQLISGNLTIISLGKALESGSKGDYIRLLNTASGQTIEGLVIGPDRVAVQTASAYLLARY